MLFFSPFIIGITSFLHYKKNKKQTYNLPSLLHIPYKLGPVNDCVLIYEWFYNTFYWHRSSSSSSSFFIHKHSMKRSYKRPVISLHHLLFFIYILFNFIHVYYIYIDVLPTTSLGVLPTIFFGSSTFTLPSPLHLLDILHTSPSVLPSIHPLSSNYDKLCYLTAWQSSMATNTKLMKFFSEYAVCIDTGASCSISNNKSDFLTFAPSTSSTVLKGIGSGLSILGTGTIKWKILNDDGDEISLHLHNCLYVPDAPMSLLSPQHMAQQTSSFSDGFNSQGKYGILTFGGFK
jgi:hypothetical protein